MYPQFRDRREAGRRLGHALTRLAPEHPIVLALPKNGVPVASEVAGVLAAQVEIFVVRKIAVPGCRVLPMGALASGGIQVLDAQLIRKLGVAARAVDAAIVENMRELRRREERYGAGYAPPLLRGRTVILVDDGLAIGLTMRAAVQAARKQQPSRVVVAAPVGARDAVAMLETEADEVVCLSMPEPFGVVDLWYERFEQTTDDEARALLEGIRFGESLAS